MALALKRSQTIALLAEPNTCTILWNDGHAVHKSSSNVSLVAQMGQVSDLSRATYYQSSVSCRPIS